MLKFVADEIYTVCAFNSFGRVYSMQIKFHSIKPYPSEHRDCFNILFYPANPQYAWQRRKIASVLWWPRRPMIIWEGAQDPNVTHVVRRDIDDRFGTCTISKIWGANDPRYLVRAKATVFEAPFWEFVPMAHINQPEFSISED